MILLLDIISTLDDEIEYVWRRKLTWVAGLYYMVGYRLKKYDVFN